MQNLCCVSFIAIMASACAQAQATTHRFSGDWENVDPKTRGITRLSIFSSQQGLRVRGWGACQPAECDWGSTPLDLLGTHVEDRKPSAAFATGVQVGPCTILWLGLKLIKWWWISTRSSRTEAGEVTIMPLFA